MKYYTNRTSNGKFCKPYWNVRDTSGRFTSKKKKKK